MGALEDSAGAAAAIAAGAALPTPAPASPPAPVRAAGGVVWRQRRGPDGGAGPVEVLLVHRPKYNDWSLPKGKLDPGEADEQAAIREVEEETGLRCALGAELPSTRYRDPRGRDKVVRYWAMSVPTDSPCRPCPPEVDEVRWVTLPEARALLSHEQDRDVLDAFARQD